MKSIRTTAVFDTWYDKLHDRQARARISIRIKRLAEGNPGKHRTLTKGVSELKIDYGPGYRVYYVERDGTTYILLCGGGKPTQTQDIKNALALADRV